MAALKTYFFFFSSSGNTEAKNQVQAFTLKVTEKTNKWTFNLSPISKTKL